jgi:glycosyltransferase involved in cell wall biosynthesis
MALNARSTTRSPLESLVLLPGLVHVLAPSVIALRPARAWARQGASQPPAVARALAAIESSVESLRVTVDLRCCALPLSGTQVHALNLVAALGRRDDVQVSVVTPSRVDPSVRPHFERLPPSVQRYAAGQPILPRPQVFHRPYQVLYDDEMRDVVTSGTRLVLTHQDMILDRAPAYFRSRDEWQRYAATTALSFLAADEVVFFSEHARGEALRDGLVDASKTSVIPPGTNHLDGGGEVTVPAALGALAGGTERPFFLMMGNAYAHKNRVFALRVAERLTSNGWEGRLVFAGEAPGRGASLDEERSFVDGHDDFATRFVDLSAVTEAERRWLYANATLLLCPTLHEGFGLVPFEAAAAGTASVYSARTSLAEYLPPEGALLDLGSVDETSRRISAAIADGQQLESIVRAIREAGEALTWARTADAYCAVYRRSLTRPVGLSLLSGHGLLAGALSQTPGGETERRLLVLFRRSAAVRLVVEIAFAVAFRLRRITSRL